MTLFEKLESLISLGYTVKFSSFIFQLEITVTRKDRDDKEYKRVSNLPLSDHFYESRVIDCIDWSMDEIEKEINENNN